MDCNLSLTECMDLLQFIKQSCRGNGRVKRQISIKFDSVDRFYPVDSDQRDSQSTLSLHTSYFIHDSGRRQTRNAMAIKSDKGVFIKYGVGGSQIFRDDVRKIF